MRRSSCLVWMMMGLVPGALLTACADETADKSKNQDGASKRKPTATAPASASHEDHPRVVLEIERDGEDWGDIVLELNAEKAPITVENFLKYVDDGFYDKLVFHRIMSNFMIQGGGFVELGRPKREGLRPPIKNETPNGLKNERGTIAMARTPQRDSATAQFFINVVDNPILDDLRRTGGYCVFGKVVEGMDVVDRIKNVEVRRNRSNPRERSEPVNPPRIREARRAATKRALFVCSGGSSRAPMAAGFWRKHAGPGWETVVAGTKPAPDVAPLTVEVMREKGIDVSKDKPGSVKEVADQPFDLVLTLCSEAEKQCPTFSKAGKRATAPVASPTTATGDKEARLKVFREARDKIEKIVLEQLETMSEAKASEAKAKSAS